MVRLLWHGMALDVKKSSEPNFLNVKKREKNKKRKKFFISMVRLWYRRSCTVFLHHGTAVGVCGMCGGVCVARVRRGKTTMVEPWYDFRFYRGFYTVKVKK